MLYQQPAHFCKHFLKVSLAQTIQMHWAADGTQQASAWNAAPEEISKSKCSAFTFDLFPNQKHVVFLFYSIPSVTTSFSATNAFYRISALHVFQLWWGIWNLTGKVKYIISLSTQQLLTGIFHSSSRPECVWWLWLWRQDLQLLSSIVNLNVSLIKLGSHLEVRNFVS